MSGIQEISMYIRAQLFIWLLLLTAKAQHPKAVFWYEDQRWADSVLSTMSLEQKIGQLYMVAAYSNKDEKHFKELRQMIEKYHIGGLIFFQGTPVKQVEMTNALQQISKIPLMVAMDAEWGAAMRLKTLSELPWAMTIGATADTLIAFEVGREIARQCRRLGVHINFGPVADLNTNPYNPIINARSFGEDPAQVAMLAQAYAHGQQRLRILACAKHFPGHGDTKDDSHLTLPTVIQSADRIKSTELSPFVQLANAGIGSIMVAHLNIPSLDDSGTPSSLSTKVINDLLIKQMGFDGLVFTDALNMKGATSARLRENIDLTALLAGVDVLLMSENVPAGVAAIKAAIESGKLPQEVLNQKVKKILQAKYWMGLHDYKPVPTEQLDQDLNSKEIDNIRFKTAIKANTLLINRGKTLPILPPYKGKALMLTSGEPDSVMLTYFNTILPTEVKQFDSSSTLYILNTLWRYEYVFILTAPSGKNPWVKFKVPESLNRFITLASLQNPVIWIHMGNPYDLMNNEALKHTSAVVVTYQNNLETGMALLNQVFGHSSFSGTLPVRILPDFPVGYGLQTPSYPVIGFATPNIAGFNQSLLYSIDKIALDGIGYGAYPGCQVLVARNGQIVYYKTFGNLTYSKGSPPVSPETLYDLASVTKIAASVPAIMHLVQNGKISLDGKIGDYLPQSRGTNKEHLAIRDILTHRAGLQAWIPFYQATVSQKVWRPGVYSTVRTFEYPYQVADSMFISRNYKDTILKKIFESPLGEHGKYLYSDLGYYLLKEIFEQTSNQTLDQWLYANVYQKIGANTLSFNPLTKFDRHRIAPTEWDQSFRNQLIQGYVHDQGAAMLGGVAGHAGLFGNAVDLARMMLLYTNGGIYANHQIFDSLMIKEFIRCQYCAEGNRRGIGFDKPQLSGQGPTCGCLSFESFGHTGFTGTLAWADPEEKIVYIFLSNRVHPDATNEKLLRGAYRTRIQQVIYDALKQ